MKLPSRKWMAAPVFLCSLLVCSCGNLPDLSPDPGGSVKITRRLYVNDPASNDSLARALFKGQVDFVLQPGRNYRLQVKTSSLGDRLALYVFDNSVGWKTWNILDPNGSGIGVDTFNLLSDRSDAAYFSGKFLPVDSTVLQRLPTTSRPWIRLQSVDSTQSHSLKFRLLIVGSLTQLPESSGTPDSSSKTAFANRFLNDLKGLFSSFGIAVSDSSSFEIVQPDISPVTVSYSNSDTALPGTRIPGYVHLYLVNRIAAAGLPAGQRILGFAPREVFNLYQNVESRVVLNASDANSILELAQTAAHETGHFFGLRHVWATTADTTVDKDLSNLDDGFTSTKTCATVLSKKGAGSRFEIPAHGGGYCLRVSGTAFDCANTGCDPSAVKNLMFAISCTGVGQDSLTSEQQVFERRGINILGAR